MLHSLALASTADTAELDRLEQIGRAHPDSAEAGLERLLAPAGVDEATRLDGLFLLGKLQADRHIADNVTAVTSRLGDLSTRTVDVRRRDDALAAIDCLTADQIVADGPLARAEALLDDAMHRLTPTSSRRVRLGCLLIQAVVKENLGHLDEAVRLNQMAIHEVDLHGPAWQRAELRAVLANVLRRAGQTEQGLQINREALKLAQDQHDPLAQSHALTLQYILIDSFGADPGRDALELAAAEGALKFAQEAGSLYVEAQCRANLSDFYLQRGRYQQAYDIAQQGLALARTAHNQDAEGVALINSGEALISLHRKDEGMRLVHQSIDRDLRADSLVSAAESLEDLGRYLERAGYLADAYANDQDLRRVNQELAHRTRERDVVELQARFEADRRGAERARLMDDNRLAQAQLRQHALRQRVWILGVGTVALLLALAALTYRRVKRTQFALFETNQRLSDESRHDPLTGAANRRHFQARFSTGEHAGRGASGRAAGALFLIDLDKFKHINDRYGHAGGDAVLVEVARRLRAVIRPQDLLVRWGGEEFLLVVPMPSTGQVDALAQRLLNALAALPVAVDDQRIVVSASVGYATFPLGPGGFEWGWEQAVNLVDTAMYVAKAQGRNRACGVSACMAQTHEAAAATLLDLEAAERRGEVRLTALKGLETAEMPT